MKFSFVSANVARRRYRRGVASSIATRDFLLQQEVGIARIGESYGVSGMALVLREGVEFEKVGEELLVIFPDSRDVFTLTREYADVVTSLAAGKEIDPHSPTVRKLVDIGVLVHQGVSRRTVVAGGVAGAAAGISVLSLPTVAAASSAIAIQGLYYLFDQTERYLEVQIPGTQGAPAVDFPEGQGNPTALTIANFPLIPLVVSSPVTQYDSSATIDSNFAYDRATWQIDVSQSTALTATYGSAGEAFPTTGATLTATFTWGTFSYVATLPYYNPPRTP